ncbi:natterin-3-like [Thunnus maccoyii]|uniref:natterin-3-like n=1 Tax=Thunnus maccoyii TaxID=8240 RepID=UPI001C4AB154|nr:natterin-3-like [Thunnus maccoyii]
MYIEGSKYRMKLSVLLLLALPALSSASLQDIIKKSSEHQKKIVPALNPDLEDRIPKITANGSMLAHLTPPEFEKSQNQSSSFIFESTNLEWQPWSGSIPNGAVSIYNDYVSRYDYVCKYGCSAGFYNPSKGLYCHYSLSGRELLGYPFDILVNKDHFEILEWIGDSSGSVPMYSVRTCSGVNVYVGKNEYGLGKVVPQLEAFLLPWEGDEYWYKHYKVLTTKKDIKSQHITEVTYKKNGIEAKQYPPEAMRMSTNTNNACESVVKTVTLSKTNQVEKSWDIGSATTLGFISGITAEIPFIGTGGSIEFSTETTKHFSKGTTVIEETTHSVSVEQNVPPNHSCSIMMVGHKYKIDIPFTARIQRTYDNGETRWTSISGTYDSIDVGEIEAVVNRCEPIPDATPCA